MKPLLSLTLITAGALGCVGSFSEAANDAAGVDSAREAPTASQREMHRLQHETDSEGGNVGGNSGGEATVEAPEASQRGMRQLLRESGAIGDRAPDTGNDTGAR